MGHLQVSSNLHDPMGRARFPGEAQTGKLMMDIPRTAMLIVARLLTAYS